MRGDTPLSIIVNRSVINDTTFFYLVARISGGPLRNVDFGMVSELFGDPIAGAHELRQKWMPYRLNDRISKDTPNLITFEDSNQADRFAKWFFTESNELTVQELMKRSGKSHKESLARLMQDCLHLVHADLEELLEEIEAEAKRALPPPPPCRLVIP